MVFKNGIFPGKLFPKNCMTFYGMFGENVVHVKLFLRKSAIIKFYTHVEWQQNKWANKNITLINVYIIHWPLWLCTVNYMRMTQSAPFFNWIQEKGVIHRHSFLSLKLDITDVFVQEKMFVKRSIYAEWYDSDESIFFLVMNNKLVL